MIALLSFAFGAVFGSFLNVLIDRLSTGRSFVGGRSYCEKCKKTLSLTDLVPVWSYLLLRGRCRYCKSRIPFRLFLVELFSGVLVSAIITSGFAGGSSLLPLILICVILLCFVGIFLADIEYGIIPDLMVGVCAFASLLLVFIQGKPIIEYFASGIGSFLFFLFLFLITRGRGMGFGDVKLAFVLGLLLGFPLIIVSLYLAFLTGAGISIILVIWRKIRFFGGTIPFGPFLVATAGITYFFGKEIMDFFLKTFF